MPGTPRPAIGRVKVWVDCQCGAEITIPDVDPEGSTIQRCGGCGRTVEVTASMDTQDISPVWYDADVVDADSEVSP